MDKQPQNSLNQKKTKDLEMIPQISTPTTRVYRADGKDCFVDITSDALQIGKFKLTFMSYDTTKPAGQRSKATIQMYLDIADALLLANNILNGKYVKMVAEEKAKALAAKEKNEVYFQQPCFVRMGGVSASKLKIQNKSRPDGKSLSRQIKLMGGMKALFVLQAEQGPGEENEKGLIVPRYGAKYNNKAEQSVIVALDEDNAKKMALMIQLYSSAYASAQYSALAMPVTKSVNSNKPNGQAPVKEEPQSEPESHDDYSPQVAPVGDDDLPF